MKNLLLAILILPLWSSPVLAERYLSTFGFSVDIPAHWTVMTRKELQANPDMFAFDNAAFANTDRGLLKQMESMVRAGRIELYFNQQTSTPGFNDNINVYRQQGRIPRNDAELQQSCRALPAELKRGFGKSIAVHDCKITNVAGLRAFYVDFDGVVNDTRSIQYQIEKSPLEVVIFTVTTQNSTLSTNRREFDDIVGSIRLE